LRNAKSLPFHELTGLEVEVIESSNRSQVGLSGLVVCETMKMLGIMTKGNRIAMVQKDGITLRFKLKDGSLRTLQGKLLRFRSEERTKRWLRRSKERISA